MTWGIDRENLVFCSTARTAEQDRLGFIHEITTIQMLARATAQIKRPRPEVHSAEAQA